MSFQMKNNNMSLKSARQSFINIYPNEKKNKEEEEKKNLQEEVIKKDCSSFEEVKRRLDMI